MFFVKKVKIGVYSLARNVKCLARLLHITTWRERCNPYHPQLSGNIQAELPNKGANAFHSYITSEG